MTKLFRTLAVFALALPLAATAQQAQTKVWVNVRAGPAGNYPMVIRLPPGSYVQVAGCVGDYRWCDVITADGQRGWADGGALYYPYGNTIVPVMGYGPSIGIPIVTFVMADYWGSYYRYRPWYGHRQYWGPGYGYGAGYAPGYGPGFGPGYGPGHHGPGHVVVPGPVYVPRPGGVSGPGHVPGPPHGPVVGLPGPHGLPGAPGLPRPPRLPHPNGLPSPPGMP